MKPKSLVLIFLILPAWAFAQISTWFGQYKPAVDLIFDDNSITITSWVDEKQTTVSEYNSELNDRLEFIDFEYDPAPFIPPEFSGSRKHWLILWSYRYLFAFDGEGKTAIGGGFLGQDGVAFQSSYTYHASSYLTEGSVEYSPDNLGIIATRKPWVENAPGQGIGETIIISPQIGAAKITDLLISIGFVSYENPGLYSRNSRPRRLRITSMFPEYSMEVELKDSPNPQDIRLPQPSGEITIEILDTYPGSRWADTCINFIQPLSYPF